MKVSVDITDIMEPLSRLYATGVLYAFVKYTHEANPMELRPMASAVLLWPYHLAKYAASYLAPQNT